MKPRIEGHPVDVVHEPSREIAPPKDLPSPDLHEQPVFGPPPPAKLPDLSDRSSVDQVQHDIQSQLPPRPVLRRFDSFREPTILSAEASRFHDIQEQQLSKLPAYLRGVPDAWSPVTFTGEVGKGITNLFGFWPDQQSVQEQAFKSALGEAQVLGEGIRKGAKPDVAVLSRFHASKEAIGAETEKLRTSATKLGAYVEKLKDARTKFDALDLSVKGSEKGKAFLLQLDKEIDSAEQEKSQITQYQIFERTDLEPFRKYAREKLDSIAESHRGSTDLVTLGIKSEIDRLMKGTQDRPALDFPAALKQAIRDQYIGASPEVQQKLIDKVLQAVTTPNVAEAQALPKDLATKASDANPSLNAYQERDDVALHRERQQELMNPEEDDLALEGLYDRGGGKYGFLKDSEYRHGGDLADKVDQYDQQYKEKMKGVQKGHAAASEQIKEGTAEIETLKKQQNALKALQSEVVTRQSEIETELRDATQSKGHVDEVNNWKGAVRDVANYYTAQAATPDDLFAGINGLDRRVGELQGRIDELSRTNPQALSKIENMQALQRVAQNPGLSKEALRSALQGVGKSDPEFARRLGAILEQPAVDTAALKKLVAEKLSTIQSNLTGPEQTLMRTRQELVQGQRDLNQRLYEVQAKIPFDTRQKLVSLKTVLDGELKKLGKKPGEFNAQQIEELGRTNEALRTAFSSYSDALYESYGVTKSKVPLDELLKFQQRSLPDFDGMMSGLLGGTYTLKRDKIEPDRDEFDINDLYLTDPQKKLISGLLDEDGDKYNQLAEEVLNAQQALSWHGETINTYTREPNNPQGILLNPRELGRTLHQTLAYDVEKSTRGKVTDPKLLEFLGDRKARLDTYIGSLEKLYRNLPPEAHQLRETLAAEMTSRANERDALAGLLDHEIGNTKLDRQIKGLQGERDRLGLLKKEMATREEALQKKQVEAQKKMNLAGFKTLQTAMQANNLRTTELAKLSKALTAEETRLNEQIKGGIDPDVNQQALKEVQSRLKSVGEEQSRLDLDYRASLLRMQKFEQDVSKGVGYPGEKGGWTDIEAWSSWAKQNMAGTWSADYRPTLPELALARQLAKNGMDSMSEAYAKLFSGAKNASSQDAVNFLKNAMSPSELVNALSKLKDWMMQNPYEAQMLAGNLQHTLEILKSNGATFGPQVADLARTAWNVGTTRNIMSDALEGRSKAILGATDISTMPPEMLALLHLAGYAPYALGAYKGVADQNIGGRLASGALAFATGGASLVPDVAARALGGMLQTKVERGLSDQVTKNRDLEVGVNAVLKGMSKDGSITDKLKETGQYMLERQALEDAGDLARNLYEGGVKGTMRNYVDGIKEWWNKSSIGEKIYRAVTQVGIPAATAGAAVAGIALMLASGPIGLFIAAAVLGGLGAGVASHFAMRGLNSTFPKAFNWFGMQDTDNAVRDKLYSNRVQNALEGVAAEMRKKLAQTKLSGEATKVATNVKGDASTMSQQAITALDRRLKQLPPDAMLRLGEQIAAKTKDYTDNGVKPEVAQKRAAQEVIQSFFREVLTPSLDQDRQAQVNKWGQNALETDEGQYMARRAQEEPSLVGGKGLPTYFQTEAQQLDQMLQEKAKTGAAAAA